MTIEKAITMQGADNPLVGIVHIPERIVGPGVLIIVGGPQTRVGSHRQFVLLARALTDAGIPVMRFDYTGMGDSPGQAKSFEDIDSDIRLALDTFYDEVDKLSGVVLWGLCDAASAALFYGLTDDRVKGLVILNPWVRSEAGQARAYLKHYYLTRLFDKNLWKKIFRGEFQSGKAIKSFVDLLKSAFAKKQESTAEHRETDTADHSSTGRPGFVGRMLQGLQQYRGRVLLILSGDDLTADEFRDTVKASRDWRNALQSERVQTLEIKEANHTFSTQAWREQVNVGTRDWVLDKN